MLVRVYSPKPVEVRFSLPDGNEYPPRDFRLQLFPKVLPRSQISDVSGYSLPDFSPFPEGLLRCRALSFIVCVGLALAGRISFQYFRRVSNDKSLLQ